MRCLIGFVCVLAALVALPLSAGAQDAEGGTTSEPNLQEPAPSAAPAAEEDRSRVERWHPEAFADPVKPAPEPPLQLGIDAAGLEVTPTAPLTAEELKRQETKLRKRRVAIGVGVALAVVGLVAGVALGVSAAKTRSGVSDFSRAGIVF